MVLFCGDNNIANPASINVAAAAAATSTGEVVEVVTSSSAALVLDLLRQPLRQLHLSYDVIRRMAFDIPNASPRQRLG
eukprot:scaffold21379_cov134-Skeletonema_marinoi.AAC.1